MIFVILVYANLGGYGITAYPILSIILAMISKKIFKKSFAPSYWLFFFIVSTIFSVIAFCLYLLGRYTDIIAPLLNMGYVEADQSMGYSIESLLFNLVPLIFFICYLINFLVRLVRRKKQKSRVSAE